MTFQLGNLSLIIYSGTPSSSAQLGLSFLSESKTGGVLIAKEDAAMADADIILLHFVD